MASDLLTPCLLSESLIEYTIGIAKDALREPDGIAKKRRAELALSFFTDILDPSIDEERRQLDIFRSYRTALNGRYVHFCLRNLPLSDIPSWQTPN